MDFPSVKTEDALAATYGVGVQATNPSHSVLGVQLDDVGKVSKKWVEVSLEGDLAQALHMAGFVTFPHLLSLFQPVPGTAGKRHLKGKVDQFPFYQAMLIGHSPVTRVIPAQNTSVLHHASPRLHPHSCKQPQLSHFPSLLFI